VVVLIKNIIIGLAIGALSFGLTACSTQIEEEAAPEENITDINDKENEYYQSEIKVAWEFVKDKGWDESAKGDWRGASVEVTNTKDGHMLDGEPERDKVLMVTFKSQENTIYGVPQIFVDLQDNKVIGFVPTE
jgi:hypothetical protein